MNCYSCDQPAINACKRCAKPYCEDHGNATYCADCLRPASALPSFNLYRGALLAMLVGTALAVVLILRPPGETKGASPVVVGRTTPTATVSSGTAEPTVAATTPQTSPSAQATISGGTGTPGANTTSTPGTDTTGTPAASGTPTPSGTRAPFIEYFAQEGDSLFSIAQAHLQPGDDLSAYIAAIATLNGFSSNEASISIGQKILLPNPAH